MKRYKVAVSVIEIEDGEEKVIEEVRATIESKEKAEAVRSVLGYTLSGLKENFQN